MLRKFVLTFSLSVLAAFVSVGSLPAAPVPKHLFPKSDPLYFPTTVGTKWHYRDATKKEVTYEVSRVDEKEGAKFVSVIGGNSSPTVWKASSEGLFIMSMGAQVCDPPVPMLRLPLASNKTWETEKKEVGGLKGLFAAHGPEEIEVKAGKFTTIRVEMEWVNHNKATVWYAPGVGVVKAVSGMHEELLSFTPAR